MVKRTRLKTERLRREMTREEAAQHADVGVGVIAAWERRERVPRADNAMKIAEAFGLSLDDCFDDWGYQRAPRGGTMIMDYPPEGEQARTVKRP